MLFADQWELAAYTVHRNDESPTQFLRPLEAAIDKQIAPGGYPDGSYIIVYGTQELPD